MNLAGYQRKNLITLLSEEIREFSLRQAVLSQGYSG